jgi:predicted Zn-dependent peptidase
VEFLFLINKYENIIYKNKNKNMSVINIKSQTQLSGFYIVFSNSTLGESKGTFGVSHLGEHLLFKNIEDMLDTFDIDGIGNNAYTSDTEIVVLFTGLEEYLSKHKETILEKLLTFNITKEQFENERKIVIEEYKMYFNKQAENHQLNLYRKKFGSFGAIGLLEDLENITYEKFKEFYDRQFSKPHMIINVSKDSIFETDIEFSTETFDKVIHYGDYDIALEPYNNKNGKISIVNMSEVITEDFAIVNFITDLIGLGLKSPIYSEIREQRGLVYYINSYLDRITNQSGVIIISSETADNNVDEFQKTLKYVLDNPKKFITQERFDIVKQATEIKLQKQDINRYNNVDKFITPIEWQVESILNDITLEKVMEVYDKYFNFDKWVKSTDDKEFLG